MTAAHLAGLSRIPLALIAAFLILEVPEGGRRIAALVVLAAGISDYLDGALARRQGTVSRFGEVLDYTTDKLFILPVLFLAVRHDRAGLWMAVLISVRELLVMGVRLHATAERVTVPSSALAKIKSILAYFALGFLLLGLTGGLALLAAATVAALLSGVLYVRSAWPVLAPALTSPAGGVPQAGADAHAPEP